jgi:hypothetical protein
MAGEIETGAAMTNHVRGIDRRYGKRILRVNISLDRRGVCWYEELLADVENSAVGEGERAKGKKSPRRHVA